MTGDCDASGAQHECHGAIVITLMAHYSSPDPVPLLSRRDLGD